MAHQRYSILSVSKGHGNASTEDQSKRYQQPGVTAKDWVMHKGGGGKVNTAAAKNPQNVSNLMASKPLPRGKTKNGRKESFSMQSYQTELGMNQRFEAASSGGFNTASVNQPQPI